ncbi:MAG: trypsin-like peptidase domain-containing protein [Nostocoides sp.]
MSLSTRHLPTVLVGVTSAALAAVVAVGVTEAVDRSQTTVATSSSGSALGAGSNGGYGTHGGYGGFGTNPYAGGSGPGSGDGSTGSSGSSGSSGNGSAGNGFPDGFGFGSGGSDGSGSGNGWSVGSSSTPNANATASQISGIVDITTTVDYSAGKAAGTGMILSSDGEILTNNHVVDGATKITVTVLSTGKNYTAKVIGTSPTNDIAVLQLADASGLRTAKLGTSSGISVGQPVTGVGNAGDAAGTSASPGAITALDQAITASDQGGAHSEHLTGLIETDADIQAGDSGGPLYDASGAVLGIDTAAQASARSGATIAGYAIPIDHALDVAHQILSGTDNATIHQGLPAFLGIQLSQVGTGTSIDGVVDGSAAAKAGLAPGDTITAIGGTAVASPAALTAAISANNPGDRVTIAWTDTNGTSHTATVTLGEGPAD